MKKSHLPYFIGLAFFFWQVSSPSLRGGEKKDVADFFQPLTAKKLKKYNESIHVMVDIVCILFSVVALPLLSFLVGVDDDPLFFTMAVYIPLLLGISFVVEAGLDAVLFVLLKAKTAQASKYHKKVMGLLLGVNLTLFALVLMSASIWAWATAHNKSTIFLSSEDESPIPRTAFAVGGFGWTGSVAYLISISFRYYVYKGK